MLGVGVATPTLRPPGGDVEATPPIYRALVIGGHNMSNGKVHVHAYPPGHIWYSVIETASAREGKIEIPPVSIIEAASAEKKKRRREKSRGMLVLS